MLTTIITRAAPNGKGLMKMHVQMRSEFRQRRVIAAIKHLHTKAEGCVDENQLKEPVSFVFDF